MDPPARIARRARVHEVDARRDRLDRLAESALVTRVVSRCADLARAAWSLLPSLISA